MWQLKIQVAFFKNMDDLQNFPFRGRAIYHTVRNAGKMRLP